MKHIFAALLLSCWCLHLHAAGESETVSAASSTSGCGVSHQRLDEIFRGLFDEELTIYINCLSFNEIGLLRSGVVSGVNKTSGVSGPGSLRLVLSCVEDFIVAKPSTEIPLDMNMTSTACLACEDNAAPCSEACESRCERCYEVPSDCTRCLACVADELDRCYVEEGSGPLRSSCDTMCPMDLVTNPDLFNLCECPNGSYRQLDDYPKGEEEEKERLEECNNPPEVEQFRCVVRCETSGFDPSEELDNICFACGLPYCLKCNRSTNIDEEDECLQCMENSILFEHECAPCPWPLTQVALNAIEQEEEREKEIEDQRLRQIELAVSLPILSVLVILVFLGMSLFAHYRYPHINPKGHKRHRVKPEDFADVTTEVVSSDDLEPINAPDVWRARPTVRLR